MVANRVSWYMVEEWLPQTTSFSTLVTGCPVRAASCGKARLRSSRIMAVKLDLGRLGADFIAM